MSSRFAVVEHVVVPVEDRAWLILERAARLPSAENRGGDAALVQERLVAPNGSSYTAPPLRRNGRPSGTRLPQRRLAIVGFNDLDFP